MKEKKFKLLVLPAGEHIDQVVDKFPFPITLTKGSYDKTEFIFQGGNVKVRHEGADLKSFSFVWLSSHWGTRDLAYGIRLYLENYNIPYTYVEKGTSKITDHMVFALNNIQTPDTLFLNRQDIQKCLPQIRCVCGYPLVVKDIKGFGGTNSAYVSTEEELLEKVKNLPRHKRFLFQKYIPNDYDWGVMVANGVVVSGEKSYPRRGEFRNNACNGATEVFVNTDEIPAVIKQMAIKTSAALGLSWSRSDIIVDKNTQEAYLMEVNRFPGISSKTSEVEGAFRYLSHHISQMTGNE